VLISKDGIKLRLEYVKHAAVSLMNKFYKRAIASVSLSRRLSSSAYLPETMADRLFRPLLS
jgi:hypothetical protein